MPHVESYAEDMPLWLKCLCRKRWCRDVVGLGIATLISSIGLVWFGHVVSAATSATEIITAFLIGSLTTFTVTKIWDKVRSHDR